MSKQVELNKLKQEMLADKGLPLLTNLVFGEGNIDCKVLFIGEAPGAEEDKLVRPFVGRSGKLLDKMLEEIGWKREEVYITNIVKRRPPDNRDPSPEEIEAYKPYLSKQIVIINPQVIAPLGRFSMNYFLPNAKITRDQGQAFPWQERVVFPLFHPAAVLRGTAPMANYIASFRKLKKLVGKD
ncbi:MAG TPA: uracil-DNA glycosylase [Candidatus Paceibacterota bacterium]